MLKKNGMTEKPQCLTWLASLQHDLIVGKKQTTKNSTKLRPCSTKFGRA